jgi:hypothetical protein
MRERDVREADRERKNSCAGKRELKREMKNMQTRAHIHTHTHTSMTVSLVLLELLHAEQHKLFAKSSKVCVCIAFKTSTFTLLLVLPIFVGENAS